MSNDTLELIASNAETTCHTDPISVEQIQDIVEMILMTHDPRVAKAYILYRDQRSRLRGLRPDQNAIADYIHASKYAKYMPHLQRRETFEDTVSRVLDMHIKKFPLFYSQLVEAFKYVFDKKVLPSMRSMQFAGGAIYNHNARMFNCCYSLIDRPKVFSEILYLLLCGCGVGFSVQTRHVDKLPRLSKVNKDKVCHFSIEDTMEGWSDALDTLINGHIHGFYVEFDYSLIRPAGAPLSSGGRAPGHLELKRSLEDIRRILDAAQGRKLRPIECYDIICLASRAVLSGGIRRSSSIALFSYNDEEMRYSKDPANFDFESKNSHRSLSNNSVAFVRNEVTNEQFMSIMDQNRNSFGEPGFVFLDSPDLGVNPCGEIIIDPTCVTGTGFGFCNLVEVNVAKLDDDSEFYSACTAASIIATFQATYTDFKYLSKESRTIAERDALIGVGLTGIMDNPWILNEEILKTGANIVKNTNKRYADLLGINPAKRCTCVKPSGTASLELGGVSSGIHPHHSKRYLRRITANPNEPVAREFRRINPHMVETKPNGDWCITFPVETSGLTLQDVTQEQFLEYVIKVKNAWADHNVSTTMVVTDWSILEQIWQRRNELCSLSFLPAMSDKGIPYCPRESVITGPDVALWGELIQKYRPINYKNLKEDSDKTHQLYEAACTADSCDISSHVESAAGYRVFIDGQFRRPEYKIIEVNGYFSLGVWE